MRKIPLESPPELFPVSPFKSGSQSHLINYNKELDEEAKKMVFRTKTVTQPSKHPFLDILEKKMFDDFLHLRRP